MPSSYSRSGGATSPQQQQPPGRDYDRRRDSSAAASAAPPPPHRRGTQLHSDSEAGPSGYTSDATHGGGGGGGHSTHHFDPQLDSTGLSTSAVQVGILKGRLKAHEQEMGRMKQELKEQSDRASQMSAKVHDLKIANHEVMSKYTNTVEKLTAAEQRERELLDSLMSEQRKAQLDRDALQRAQAQQDAHDERNQDTMRAMQDRMRQMQHQIDEAEQNNARALSDEQTKNLLERNERLQLENEDLIDSFREAIERLCNLRDEDETSLMVARSALMSTASELEARLATADSALRTLRDEFTGFVDEVDKDTAEILQKLMAENRQLYEQVSARTFEVEQLESQLKAEQRRGRDVEGPLKDQNAFLETQLEACEKKLERNAQTMEEQAQSERDIADRLESALDEIRILNQKLEQAQTERAAALRAESEASQRAKDLAVQAQHEGLAKEDAERERDRLQDSVDRLDHELRSVRETSASESRHAIDKLRAERDDAVKDAEQCRADLDEAMRRMQSLQNELEVRDEQSDRFRSELEETQDTYRRTLQERLSDQKRLYETQFDELKKEATESAHDAEAAQRLADDRQAELQVARAALKRAEEAAAQLDRDSGDASDTIKKLEKRIRELTLELDAERSARQTEAARATNMEAVANQLRSQIDADENRHEAEKARQAARVRHLEDHQREIEQQKITITEEVRRLRVRAGDDQALAAVREKAERDRQMLQRENDRLQREYHEAQKQLAQSQATISQLKTRLQSNIVLQAQVDDMQRQNEEVPELRRILQQYEEEVKELKQEAWELKRSRDEIEQKLDRYLERCRVAAEKDRMYDKAFRSATDEVHRVERQLNATNESVSASRRRDRGGDGLAASTSNGSRSPSRY